MHKRTIALSITVMLFLLACQGAAQSSRGGAMSKLGFTVGEAFPDIVLPDINTLKPTSLSDFRGKKLIVLHFASW